MIVSEMNTNFPEGIDLDSDGSIFRRAHVMYICNIYILLLTNDPIHDYKTLHVGGGFINFRVLESTICMIPDFLAITSHAARLGTPRTPRPSLRGATAPANPGPSRRHLGLGIVVGVSESRRRNEVKVLGWGFLIQFLHDVRESFL